MKNFQGFKLGQHAFQFNKWFSQTAFEKNMYIGQIHENTSKIKCLNGMANIL